MIIFGFRSYLRGLGIVTLVCGACGRPAAHRIVERIRKFTLFFIPLFPVSKSRALACTFCGQTTAISAEQARQYLASAQQQEPQAQLPAQQPPLTS